MRHLLLDPSLTRALGFAAVTTAILAAFCVAAGLRARPQAAALVFMTLLFAGLTQFPLPDPVLLTMQCPMLYNQPNWVPLFTAVQIIREWQAYLAHPDWVPFHMLSFGPRYVEGWLRYRSARNVFLDGWSMSALMNLLFCLPIGALLFPYLRRAWVVALVGFVFSLLLELTQLTATWGLYPCAYRKFDADDLVLNTLGIVLGFLAVRRLYRAVN